MSDDLADLLKLVAAIQAHSKPMAWVVCYRYGSPTGGRSFPLQFSKEYCEEGCLLLTTQGENGTIFQSYREALVAVLATVKFVVRKNLKWFKMYGPLLIVPVYSSPFPPLSKS